MAREVAGMMTNAKPPYPIAGSQPSLTAKNKIKINPNTTPDMDCPRRANIMANKSMTDPLFTPAIIPMGILMSRAIPMATSVKYAVAGNL